MGLPKKGWEMLYRLRDAGANGIAAGMLEDLFIKDHRRLGNDLIAMGYPLTVTDQNGERIYRLDEGAV